MPDAVIDRHIDLIERIRQRKAELGLADEYFEAKAGMSEGSYHKYFGLMPCKFMSTLRLFDVCSFLGLDVVVTVNPAYNPKAINEWQRRDERKVSVNGRISKAVMEMAKPLVHKAMSAAGGHARAANLAASRQAAIARKGGQSRMRKLTKAQRSELAGLAARARWAAAGAAP